VQSCIVDTCSSLHIFHIEIGTSSLAALLEGHFQVLVHKDVDAEVPGALRKAYGTWKRGGLVSEDFSSIRRRHATWMSSKLRHDDMGQEFSKLGSDLKELDAGERACVAFTKHTAEQETSYPLFLTDDYAAAKTAEAIFGKYQCGFVVRTADLITFFGFRYQLAKIEIHQCLRDLLAFYNAAYENLMNAVRAEGKNADVLYDLIWRSEFQQANRVLANLSFSTEARHRLEVLLNEVTELGDREGIIAYTIARLRLLVDSNI